MFVRLIKRGVFSQVLLCLLALLSLLALAAGESCAATVTITGPGSPVTGSQYTASGGTAPYTWCISKGSITQNGIVTVSGQCGSATIMATDACGNTTTKIVTMPGGSWQDTSTSPNIQNPWNTIGDAEVQYGNPSPTTRKGEGSG